MPANSLVGLPCVDKMNKNILLKHLLAYLAKELAVLTAAANNARAASIDEQSVAETQYDTLYQFD